MVVDTSGPRARQASRRRNSAPVMVVIAYVRVCPRALGLFQDSESALRCDIGKWRSSLISRTAKIHENSTGATPFRISPLSLSLSRSSIEESARIVRTRTRNAPIDASRYLPDLKSAIEPIAARITSGSTYLNRGTFDSRTDEAVFQRGDARRMIRNKRGTILVKSKSLTDLQVPSNRRKSSWGGTREETRRGCRSQSEVEKQSRRRSQVVYLMAP